tara:strand:+ start:312 stop:902 length:591 start_codon:yes stop_codon:yes gene_type:complete
MTRLIILIFIIQLGFDKTLNAQPDTIKEFVSEILLINEKMKATLKTGENLYFNFDYEGSNYMIVNDSLGNISSAYNNNMDVHFKNNTISKAKFSTSRRKYLEYHFISNFEIEFASFDSVAVDTFYVDDCIGFFIDTVIRWGNGTYPIRVFQQNELVALIQKDSFEVLNKDLFKEEDYATIVAALKEQRYFKDKFIH